jgi:hypothetical protein
MTEQRSMGYDMGMVLLLNVKSLALVWTRKAVTLTRVLERLETNCFRIPPVLWVLVRASKAGSWASIADNLATCNAVGLTTYCWPVVGASWR